MPKVIKLGLDGFQLRKVIARVCAFINYATLTLRPTLLIPIPVPFPEFIASSNRKVILGVFLKQIHKNLCIQPPSGKRQVEKKLKYGDTGIL